jgi:outer membrane protein assembly factor BamE (lipoprotein component of BamABCDE complex)
MKTVKILAICATIGLAGCMTTAQHKTNVGIDNTASNMTVGTVQKEIRVGMSGAEVASVLGSPNIVTTDEKRREVWVYDKVATEYVTSTSNGWVFALLAGGQSKSGASSRSQRTLTIVIKFDNDGLVRDFAYHTSKF